MKTVLFLTDLHVGSHVAELEAVYERARDYGWHVVEVEYEHSSRPIGDYVRTWRPDGCIFSCASLTEPLEPRVFRGLPTVYLDPDPKTLGGGHHCVVNHPQPRAEIAFRELSRLGCTSFAYVGWNDRTTWSEARRSAFGKIARAHGARTEEFLETWSPRDRIRFHQKLAHWLKKLPAPCGVFAANDDTASQVADACHFAGIRVPQDIAVIGVDNLEIICENAVTSLSSIEIDFHDAGRVAADFLAELLDDPSLPPATRTFGDGRLVRRQSTRDLAACDARIARALERIRREACFGITASDVIAETGLPRRVAERWFRRAAGMSILGEINRNRLERVYALLRKPDYPISLIAQQCGWQTDVFLKRLFKRTTGLTMREWRKRELA